MDSSVAGYRVGRTEGVALLKGHFNQRSGWRFLCKSNLLVKKKKIKNNCTFVNKIKSKLKL